MKNIILPIILLLSLSSFAQKEPTALFKAKVNLNLIAHEPLFQGKDFLVYGLQFISGCADGANQAIVYHGIGRGNSFWDYSTSWKNKYKDYDHGDLRPAFPGAKTWLVAFTDGNHSTRAVSRGANLGALLVALVNGDKDWLHVAKDVVISSLINRAGFTLFYDHILKTPK